ncbi:hypothetical protein E8E14_010666 [Neopestalotiopsis sp. 37M]|nr:hypothetical protein E8E14_010666 [Neopestalotiopsis sp. 37M]
MANPQHFYFYAPTWDYPPDGPIKLGNVLTSVGTPQRPLTCVPPGDSDAEGDNVFSTKKTDAEYTKEKLRSGKFSILTKFLSKCAEASGVRRYLEQTRHRKPVYIITGVKVVTGISASTESGRSTGANIGVEVDGTVWSGGAVPIGGGPSVEHTVSSGAKTRWDGSDDFVFAYRLSRVSVSKKTHQVASEEEYQKGAMLGKEAERAAGPALSVSDLHDADPEAEGFSIEAKLDDGEAVLCAFPKE